MTVQQRKAERDQRIVALRQAGATLREIGQRHGLSYERVRQIWQRAQRMERAAIRATVAASQLRRTP